MICSSGNGATNAVMNQRLEGMGRADSMEWLMKDRGRRGWVLEVTGYNSVL